MIVLEYFELDNLVEKFKH